MIFNCAPAIKIIDISKNQYERFALNSCKEFQWECELKRSNKTDTLKIISENYKNSFVIFSDTLQNKTYAKAYINRFGYNSKFYSDFVLQCIKQEASNQKISNQRKYGHTFLLKNLISPSLGAKYVFSDNPFIPRIYGKVLPNIYLSTDVLFLGVLIHGILMENKNEIISSFALLGLFRLIGIQNYLYLSMYNENYKLKYDFSKIVIEF